MSLTSPTGLGNDSDLSLDLQPPKPVVHAVEGDEASQMLGEVPAVTQAKLGEKAKNFTMDLVKYDPRSPEFKARVQELSALAKSTIVATTDTPNRMLERSQSSVSGSKQGGGDASQQAAKTLTRLRGLVEELTPNRAELLGVSKIFGFIPGGNKLRRYFHRYQSAQVQLNSIINALLKSEDELAKDSASLQQEQIELWQNMQKLNEYTVLATKLDQEIVREIAALRAAGNVQGAQALENDVLFVVRQRRQDILTQLAAAAQGYLAINVVQKNNEELAKGVERARNVTVTALRTAVVIAQALDNQKLVLDQIDALQNTTERTLIANSEMLRQQTTRIQQQAANPAVSLKALETAFKSAVDTLDAIDSFKAKANVSMETTINALNSQLERTRPVLERARALTPDEQQQALPAGRNHAEGF